MSRLSKFLGEPKEIEIEGERIILHPLRVKDLAMFKENLTDNEKLQLSRNIIKRSLNDPTVTDEEIDNLKMETFVALMNEISKLNGFEDERIRKIKESVIQNKSK